MRSLGFDAPDELIADEYSVVVDIYTETPGGDDDDGNPAPPQRTYYVQGAPGDLQPQSGSRRAMQSGTVYESTHRLFLWPTDSWPVGLGAEETSGAEEGTGWPEDAPATVLIQQFFQELAENIPKGATVVAQQRGLIVGTFSVVFVANWGTHLEIDLQAVTSA